MDFQLSEEQTELRESVRRYAKERLAPIAEEIEQSGEPPSAELVREFAQMGYLGINVPEDLGGQGLSNLDALIVVEELGRVSSAIAFPVFESCVGPVRAIEKICQPGTGRRSGAGRLCGGKSRGHCHVGTRCWFRPDGSDHAG